MSQGVLPQPDKTKGTDWAEKRKVAIEAWKLGSKTMVPKPARPAPRSRLAQRR